jgi:hypothetical protein
MRLSKPLIAVAACAALVIPTATAFAQEGGADCTEAKITVVDSAERVVHHDAETHTVSHPAVLGDRVLSVWTGGPVENPSADADGWNQTSGNPQGGPFQGRTDGVPFFVSHGGSGNGDWFMFNTPVIAEAYDELIVDAEAYNETIPAVTHEEPNPAYPCDDPGDPGDPGEPPVIDDPGDTNTGGGIKDAVASGHTNDAPAVTPAVGVKAAHTSSGDLPPTL